MTKLRFGKKRRNKELYVASNLRYYLIKEGLNPEDLASLCGTSLNTVYACLDEKYVPSMYLALCFACALDVSVSDLYFLNVREE